MIAGRDLRAVNLVLTTACNLRCSYCFQDARRGGRMRWKTARAAADLLLASRHPAPQLVFYGGEPLLEFPLLQRVVRYMDRAAPPGKRVRFVVSTNGTLLDDESAEFLAERGFATNLSFDGTRRAQDFRAHGTFDALDRLLDRLRRGHPSFFRKNLAIGITLTPRTIPFLAGSIRYFLGKGVRRISIAPPVTDAPEWRDEMLPALDRQFRAVHRLCLEHYRRTMEVPLALFRHGRAESRRRLGAPICAAADGGALTVDVDGQVSGCVVLVESYQEIRPGFLEETVAALRLGDLRDRGFPSRLAAYPDAARAARFFHERRGKYSSHGSCRDCPFAADCGICPVSVANIPGNRDPNRVPDFPCAFNRVALKWRRRFPRLPDALDILGSC